MAEQIRGSGGDESPLNRGRKNESALSLHHSELVQGFSTWFNKKQAVTSCQSVTFPNPNLAGHLGKDKKVKQFKRSPIQICAWVEAPYHIRVPLCPLLVNDAGNLARFQLKWAVWHHEQGHIFYELLE